MPLKDIMNASYLKDGKVVHNESRPQLHTEELDALPFATDVYAKHLKIENYNVPFLVESLRVVLHDARLPGAMHFLFVAADAFGACLAGALD